MSSSKDLREAVEAEALQSVTVSRVLPWISDGLAMIAKTFSSQGDELFTRKKMLSRSGHDGGYQQLQAVIFTGMEW
jgi:hypothetical protein